VVSRFEPHRALSSAPLGKLDFRLFAPAKLLPANKRLKLSSDILGQIPLAMLEAALASGKPSSKKLSEWHQVERATALSSYPQLAQAVSSLEVAAIMPRLAEVSFESKASVRFLWAS